ncbi:MAG: M3 family oligoendopeptidase [Peptoniphilaceae bacterium]
MKFKEMPYTRFDTKKVLNFLDKIILELNDSESYEEALICLKKFNEFKTDLETNINLAYTRHSIDTRDAFYEKENNFIDKNLPIVSSKLVEVYKAIVNSKFRKELENEIGSHYFKLLECEFVINERAIPFMQKENELISQYSKLIANSKIYFKGEIYSLSQIAPHLQNPDRKYRKEAYEAKWKFFQDNIETFDNIFDKLVKIRHEMAKSLGYKNYIDLRYKLLKRTDYNSKDVAEYRKKVLKYISPFAAKLRKNQAKRINIEDFKFYDRPLEFIDGNPNPQGSPDDIIKKAQKMYRELSPETGKFFDFMVDKELMDLVAKAGKRAGGYCTSFDKYKSPFIFSNFNGTKGDIDVITHEAGHAFQNYMSQDKIIPEYIWPTYEACEIHSMSMEFLTWPYMEYFFGDYADKFRYQALTNAICFIPYGATIDHFQHFVYENPTATPEERRKKFHELEMMYDPNIIYDNEFLENGGYWFGQGHVFNAPFYYIDYTLAQVCAFQYLIKSIENPDQALAEYITLCKAGGEYSFFDLIDIGKIKNPINTNILKDIIPKLEETLNNIEIN